MGRGEAGREGSGDELFERDGEPGVEGWDSIVEGD